MDVWVCVGGGGRLVQPRVAAHVAARTLCLIALPTAVYLASFAAHFAVLTRTGPGDSAMPSLFQAALIGSPLATQPPGPPAPPAVGAQRIVRIVTVQYAALIRGTVSTEVVFGSLVTLRNNGAGGALLHSHVQTYPAGSKQQQVRQTYLATHSDTA
jgi:dolichyl-phosphate-mannose-protein mannosyltransferase